MNFCRLYPLMIILCVVIGLLAGKRLGLPLHLAAFFGMLAGMLPIALVGVIYAAFMFWRPDLPPCKCGQTKYGEYEYIGPMEGFSEDSWCENRCPKCGRHYKSRGNIVVECRPDGSVIPYMKVSKWGRWERDNSETCHN
jgi:hypothetical protein